MRRLACALVILGVSVATFVAGASAGSFTAGPLRLASGPSPFATCTVGGPGTNYPNTEIEPWVDVNPTNANNIIGVYQQDRWDNGGAHGLVATVSKDGGVTWTQSFAHFSICAGGTAANGGDYERSSDPWVSFAPNGDAYQIAIAFNQSDFTNGVLVSKSTDGGTTWSEPTTLIRDTSPFNFNDKESITADPASASRVYAVWDRTRHPGENPSFGAFHSAAFRGDIMFSRTTNGGTTWEPARDILARNANLFTIGNQIAVLPDGTLIDLFNMGKGSGKQHSPNQFTQAVIRSTDHGVTWSDRPITVALDFDVPVVDPDNPDDFVRAGTFLPDIAVDPNDGTIYVVWADGRFSGGSHPDVVLSKSTDKGLTWSEPIKVNKTPVDVAAFTPAVDVSANGTVAVTYYDFRNNTPDKATLPTDFFIVHSHDHGATFGNELKLTDASFDMRAAPVARGFFVGDYEGLASFGNTFYNLWVQSANNPANRTDAYLKTAG
jgi:Neuraminidase (sialidase)